MSTSTVGVQTMSRRVTPTAMGVLGVGMASILLSLWANPVALGRFVPAPTPHTVYFFLGVLMILLSIRVMRLERRLSSLEGAVGGASDSR
jgi:succinate-acetate transporter protein